MIRMCLFGLLLILQFGCGEKVTVRLGATPWGLDEANDTWWMSTVHVGGQRWVVGGSPQAGRILHDDGGGFKELPLDANVSLLNWIHRFEGGGFATVGQGGAVLSSPDGLAWKPEPVDTEQALWGVWGASLDDVWVVGGNGWKSGDAVVFRGPLDDLRPVDVPVLSREKVNAFYKVWGSGPDDVYIVGQKGAILHWDGSALVERSLDLTADLIGIWGTGPNRVAVVGGRGNGVVGLWDGNSWRGIDLAPMAGLNGVWLRGDTLHAVGVFATAVKIDFVTGDVLGEEEYLREQFSEAKNVDLHAIHGSDAGRVTAIGGNYMQPSGPYNGVVVSRGLGPDE